MKNLLIFLFGIGVGVGGTIIWLRKDIQKQLEEIRKQANEEMKEEEVPFQVADEKEKAPEKTEAKRKEKVEYHKVEIPVKEEDEEDIVEISDETDGGIYEIDVDEMMHNHEYEKERLVYFRGDKILSTEAGTIIGNPFILIGGEWESCVGNYAENTAFIRNPKLVTDYEIYVEDGLYSDEYGEV